MTRETKVGLIVGMGVILLIGIIVSDHLSEVSRQEPAGLAGLSSFDRRGQSSRRPEPASRMSYAPPADGSRVGPAIADSSVAASPPKEPEVIRFGQLPRATAMDPGSPSLSSPSGTVYLPSELPPNPSGTASAGSSLISAPVASAPNPAGSDLLVRVDADHTALPTLSNTNVMRAPAVGVAPGAAPPGLAPGPGPGDPGLSAVPLTTTPQRMGTATAVQPKIQPNPTTNLQPVIHYVKSGETLWRIAQQYYGTGDQWRVIAEANSSAVDRNGSVREGVRLVIPNKAGLVPDRPGAVLSGDMGGVVKLPPAQSPGRARTITVQAGDSLTRLAQQHLGSSSRWQQLFEANRDQLDRPDEIRSGMQLRLPDQESSGGASSVVEGSRVPINSESGGSASAPTQVPAAEKSGKSYLVKASDSLYSIASATLGDGNRWQEIYEANRDQLDSPDDIHPGQTLKIPNRAKR